MPNKILLGFLLVLAGCAGAVSDDDAASLDALSSFHGQIVGLAGKCLDVRGASTVDGTPVQLYHCNGTAAQVWSLTNGALVGVGGKCLTASRGGNANGVRLVLATCVGGPTQAFQYKSGAQELVIANGNCVDVPGAQTNDYTQVWLWRCWGGANQRWVLKGSVSVQDAGTPPTHDAGTPPTHDAGTPPATDAGTPPPPPPAQDAGTGPVPTADFYVSPSGNDGNPGTKSAPFLTVQKAQSALRAALPSASKDLSVSLMPGVYPLTSTLAFTSADSGKNGHTVTWQGSCGAVLSGGTAISGWTLHDAGKNIYAAPIPSGFDPRQLYVNDRRATRARSALNSSAFSNLSATSVSTTYPVSSYAHPERLETVSIYSYWRMSRCPITSVSGNTLTFAQPCGNWQKTTLHNGVSWLENAYELLDEEGEFYVSPSDRLIYYKPRAGENMASAVAYAGSNQQLLSFNGASNITVTGLQLAYSGWLTPSQSQGYADWQSGYYYTNSGGSQAPLPATVEIDGSTNIRLLKNDLVHLGAGAINVLSSSSSITVQGNRIEDVGGHGVQLGNALAGAGSVSSVNTITVADNLIASTGAEFWDADGIFIPAASNVTVSHNQLNDFPYTAIAIGWGWAANSTWTQNLLVDANLIFNFMNTGTDGGAIYAMSNSPGSKLSNNYIHDDLDPGNGARPLNPGSGYSNGGSLYLEQGAGHFTVTGNVVTKTFRWLFAWSSDEHDNTVSGNYSDTSQWQNSTSASKGNAISQATVVQNGSWPAAAQSVISGAGVESSYRGALTRASCSQ